MNVVLYSTPSCPYCHQAREFLQRSGVRFTEHDVSRDQSAATEMVRRTGQNGVPVIVVNDQAIVGFNRARLEMALKAAANSGAKRPSLGLRVADTQSQAGVAAGLAGQRGAYVGSVVPGSPAAAAGIAAGDVVTAVDGRPVEGAAGLQALVPVGGRRLIFTILRQGQPRNVTVDL